MSAIVKQSLQKQCKNYQRIHGQTEGEAAVTPPSMNTPMIHLALSYQSTLLKLTHNSLFFCTIFKNFAWWWLMTLDSLRRRRWFPITVPPILSHARGGGLCPVLQQDDTLQCVRRLPKLKDAVHHVPLTLSAIDPQLCVNGINQVLWTLKTINFDLTHTIFQERSERCALASVIAAHTVNQV